jgi:hypothetical protein
MKINQLPPPTSGDFVSESWKSGRIELAVLFIFLNLTMIGEVKAQLQTYLNGATPATTF